MHGSSFRNNGVRICRASGQDVEQLLMHVLFAAEQLAGELYVQYRVIFEA